MRMRAEISLGVAAVLGLSAICSPAFAEEEPPPPPPYTVPPLESEPLVIPESTTPEGCFANCWGPDPVPVPEVVQPAPQPWGIDSWTPEQKAALSALGPLPMGGTRTIYTAPDGSLIIQEGGPDGPIGEPYSLQSVPNLRAIIELDGKASPFLPRYLIPRFMLLR